VAGRAGGDPRHCRRPGSKGPEAAGPQGHRSHRRRPPGGPENTG